MFAYGDRVFRSAYDLMFTFCLNTKFNSFYEIFDSFSAVSTIIVVTLKYQIDII